MAKNLLRRIIRWAAEMPHPAEQYYSPKLSLSEERALLRRNYLLLMTGQAALGLIGPEIRGIAIETRSDEVVLHIAVTSDTEALREDVKDITDDLDAYLAGGPEKTAHTDQHPDPRRPSRHHLARPRPRSALPGQDRAPYPQLLTTIDSY